MSSTRLVLLRHGQTEWNAGWRMQGRLDPELDATGEAQAVAAAPHVARYAPTLLVASDQLRAWRTAGAVAEVTGLTPRAEPRLRETAMGEWEGLTGPEVEAGWPGGIEAWRTDPTWAPPGGESRCDVAERALPVLHELVAELAPAAGAGSDAGSEAGPDAVATGVVVAHGGTITALTAGFLGWPVVAWPTLQPLRNCRWAVLEHRFDTWRLSGWGLGEPGPAAGS